MHKCPNGQTRPADAIGLAEMIGKIVDEHGGAISAAAQFGSMGDKKRAANTTPERRKEIVQRAAEKR